MCVPITLAADVQGDRYRSNWTGSARALEVNHVDGILQAGVIIDGSQTRQEGLDVRFIGISRRRAMRLCEPVTLPRLWPRAVSRCRFRLFEIDRFGHKLDR
jgi:hypothetical protein